MILAHPSYDNICYAVKHIISQMDTDDFRPSLIIGLARGGLIPAVMVSESINVKLQCVHYSSKKGKGNDKNHDNILPPITDQKIILIDDIVDTGESMNDVYQFYYPNNDVRVASIYYKEGAVIRPNYYWHILPKDAPFIYFPWERNVKYMVF